MMRLLFLLITTVYAMNILSQNQRTAYVGDEIQLYAPSSNDSKRKVLHRVFWTSSNSCANILTPADNPVTIRITAEGTANIKCAAEFYDPYYWSINDPLYGSDYHQPQITTITCIKKNNGDDPGGDDNGNGGTNDNTIPNPKLGEGWTYINGGYFCAVQTEEGVTMKFGNSGNNRKCWTFYWSYGESVLGVCVNPTTSGKVTIPSNVDGCTTAWIGDYSFRNCDKLTEVVIPNTVESIKYAAFWGCSSLKTVTIPASVTYIDDAAFDGCSSLTTVTCLGTTPPKTPSSGEPFRWGQYKMTLYVPKGAKTAYEASSVWSKFKEIKEIGETDQEKITLSVSPSGSEVTSSSKIYLSTPNVTGADIYYTLNGSTPSKNSTPYTSSGIIINESCTLKAIAYKDGYETSDVLTETYTIKETPVVPTSIVINPSSKTITAGGTFTATYTLTPSNATTTLTWSSDDTSIATVSSSGVVKGIKAGTTIIRVKTANGKTDYCNVTVESSTIDPTGITLPYSKTVKVGETLTMTYTLTPSNATTTLTWSSDDTRIATVSSSGVVKGIKIGTTNIRVKTTNGKTDYCKVTVEPKESEGDLKDGDSFVAKTKEGIDMTFVVINAKQKTCQVGKGFSREEGSYRYYYYSIDLNTSGTVTIPEKLDNGYEVVKINDGAFINCSNIKRVVIPSSVKEIGEMGFAGCELLAFIDIQSSFPPTIVIDEWPSFYSDQRRFALLTVPRGTKNIYKSTEGWKLFRNIIEEGNIIDAKGQGTPTNPYNVSKAIQVCYQNGPDKPENESYTEGIITEIREVSTNYGNAEFVISDSNDGGNLLTVYRALGPGNKMITNEDIINIGDKVLICGKLFFYKNLMPEYASGCYIVSINGIGEQLNITLSSAGYATLYSSYSAYTLPNGLSAQVVTGASNNKLTYKPIADGSVSGVVPKGTAVMLVSEAKQAGTFTLTATDNTATYAGTNLLRGSDEATTTTGDGYHYKLSYGPSNSGWNKVFGWYWGGQNGAPFQIEGHKAWLVVPKSNGARSYTIDGDATGISQVGADETEGSIYDLQGRRIKAPVMNGVYIQNGRKVVVK